MTWTGNRSSLELTPHWIQRLRDFVLRHPEVLSNNSQLHHAYKPKYAHNDSSPEAIAWRKKRLEARQFNGDAKLNKALAKDRHESRRLKTHYSYTRVVPGGLPGGGKRA